MSKREKVIRPDKSITLVCTYRFSKQSYNVAITPGIIRDISSHKQELKSLADCDGLKSCVLPTVV
jgi:hypothetical protein